MMILASEISGDPLDRGYATMTAAEIADSLNAVNRPGLVPAEDVRRYLMLAGKWAFIADDAVNHATAETRRACLTLTSALESFEAFDLQDATILAVVSGGLDGLVSTGHLVVDDKAAILGLENNRQSRGQEIGAGRVTIGAVERARP